MENGNYVNHYVEILTGTMTDAVIRNISLQANAKVIEEILKERTATIESLKQEVINLNTGKSSKEVNLEQTINGHLNRISELEKQLNDINALKSEYENVKHQVQHVNTFRSELVKARQENEELKKQIEYLQLSPAKRKKIDEANAVITESTPEVKEEIRDAGIF
jgi:uncharacterized phage infection (PIP) family protein YhgE